MPHGDKSTIQLGVLKRTSDLSNATFDKEKRTVRVTFSSESPVRRYIEGYGVRDEILDHREGSIRMDRMRNGAAVLLEHDTDQGCGITKSASINGTRGEAEIRFSRSPLGDQAMNEVEDGTLRWLSVGYRVHAYEFDEDTEQARAVDWEPMEVSLVRIPADPSCKAHRNENIEEKEVTIMFKRHIQLDAQATPTAGGGGGSASVTSQPQPYNRGDEIREIAEGAMAAELNHDHDEVQKIARECMNSKTPDAKAFYRQIFNLPKKQVDLTRGGATRDDIQSGNVGTGYRGATGYKPIGMRFVESESYKRGIKLPKGARRIEMFDDQHYSFREDQELSIRTTLSASGQSISGTSGANIAQLPGVNVLNQQPLYVSDLFAQGTTAGDIVRFIIEDTYTQAATRVAEGSAKPEATLDVSVANATVEKTATWLKVTEEMLEDFEQMQSFITGRLGYMVQSLEDTQLISGSGSSQIKGVLNWSGIQTVSGAIGTIDALCRAIEYVRGANGVGFATATALIMHPKDWLNVRLSKDANGQYLLGGPTFGAYGVGGYSNVAMAWGVPVVTTTSITQGNALTGDFRMGAQIFRRKGLTLATTNSDNDDFQKNLITIRAEQRMTLAVYQPNRFCSITGIPA